MDELNDGDAERSEADTRPMGEFGSQLGAIGLGQAFAPIGVARAGVPWTTVLPEPGWLQKLGAGFNPSNAIGAALDRLQQRTFVSARHVPSVRESAI